MPLDGIGIPAGMRRAAAWYRKRTLYRAAFASPEGRAVLADLLQFCRADELSFNPRSPDPAVTAFNEGRRSVALHLSGILHLSHADIARLAQGRAEDGRDEDEAEA